MTTTSADGLQTTRCRDLQGRGGTLFDRSESAVATNGTDGSVTLRSETRAANGSLVTWRTRRTSDDGLSVTTKEGIADAAGNDVTEATTTDVTVLEASGATMRTVKTVSRDETVLSNVVTTTTGDGLLATVVLDGGTAWKTTRTDQDEVRDDGGAVHTTRTIAADGVTLINGSQRVVDLGGTRTVTTSDLDGDGHDDIRKTSTLAANGAVTTTTEDLSAAGIPSSTSSRVDDVNGTRTILTRLGGGPGTLGGVRTDQTILATNGSREEDDVETAANGATQSLVTIQNGDGRHVSRTWTSGTTTSVTTADVSIDADGRRATARSMSATATRAARNSTETLDRDGAHRVLTIAQDGYTERLETQRDSHGALVTTTSSSADSAGGLQSGSETTVTGYGLSTTVKRFAGATSALQQTETDVTELRDDGSSLRTRKVVGVNDALLRSAVIETSATGRRVTTTFDLDGGGADRVVKATTSILDDGSRRTDALGYAGDGLTLVDSVASTVSGDGLSSGTLWSRADHSIADESQTAVTAWQADGRSIETVTSRRGSDVLSTQTATRAANGLSTTTVTSVNGQAEITTTDTTVSSSDGGRTRTVTRSQGGHLDKEVTRTSADGRTQVVSRDIDGNGTAEQEITTLVNLDGSSRIETRAWTLDHAPAGGAVRIVSDDALYATVGSDDDGDGVDDRTRTETTRRRLDGAQTVIAEDRTTQGDFLSRRETSTTADGASVESRLFERGGTQASTVEQTTLRLDGSKIVERTDYDVAGLIVTHSTATISADGRVTTTVTDATAQHGAMTETRIRHIDGSVES